METIIRFDVHVGKRIGLGYPRFTRWQFSARISDIESKFNSSIALFPWEVETYEKGTKYFKSLNLKYVCEPLPEKKREKLALSIQPIHPTEQKEDLGYDDGVDDYQTGNDSDGICASVLKEIGGSVGRNISTFCNEYPPPSKKRLFSDGNSKVPSTIPELYAAMLESEKRIISFCRNEFEKIRKEMKGAGQDDDAVVEEDVGGKAAGDKAAVQEDVDGKAAIEEDVEEVGELQDVAFVRTAGEQDSLGEGVKLGKGGEGDEAVVQGVKVVGSILDLEELTSPDVCFIGETLPSSVVALTKADPHVEYRDLDKQRGRKRLRYLESLYTDPMPNKTKKSKSNEQDVDLVEFTSFLKNDDQVSSYTGQIIPMTRQVFQYLVNVDKWISDMHIQSFFDILWRRRSSSELSYMQNIGLVNTSFFVNKHKHKVAN
ncbi:hypothetical protein LWI29_038117 [Acer saccharum]|uniref:Uncharacterized protein n=1 Tax=Acer saccharum TaxID=4024 RepID=A0AA39VCY4_ACESA|nr:hypothetical protein LWI29_038117 [Acer saccharum]